MSKENREGIGLPLLIGLFVAILVLIASALKNDTVALWATIVPLLLIAICLCFFKFKKTVPAEERELASLPISSPTQRSTTITSLLVAMIFILNGIGDYKEDRIKFYFMLFIAAYAIFSAIVNLIEIIKKKETKIKYITEIIGTVLGGITIPAFILSELFTNGEKPSVAAYIICITFSLLACALFVYYFKKSVRRYREFKKRQQ